MGPDENQAHNRFPDRNHEAKTKNQRRRSVAQKKTKRENLDANFAREKSAPDSARRLEKIDRGFSKKYFRSGSSTNRMQNRFLH
jgi:hypothetical protein